MGFITLLQVNAGTDIDPDNWRQTADLPESEAFWTAKCSPTSWTATHKRDLDDQAAALMSMQDSLSSPKGKLASQAAGMGEVADILRDLKDKAEDLDPTACSQSEHLPSSKAYIEGSRGLEEKMIDAGWQQSSINLDPWHWSPNSIDKWQEDLDMHLTTSFRSADERLYSDCQPDYQPLQLPDATSKLDDALAVSWLSNARE